VQRYRTRVAEPIGNEINAGLEKWASDNGDAVERIYDTTEPFEIENDRMAELLLPLQVVLTVTGDASALELLEEYAQGLDERDRQQESQTPGVVLLAACQEIFKVLRKTGMPTADLIKELVKREEEPWHRWNKGDPIGPEALANLLRKYGIRPERDKTQEWRGYFACDFEEAWDRYLPAPKKPG
jgi:putative DNA primase/helicase